MKQPANRMPILLAGMGLGAGFMYFIDPVTGRRRRALVGDKLHRVQNLSRDLGDKAIHDLKNRTQGIAAQARHWFRPTEPPTDKTLEARVRSRLGRVITHPAAVEVAAKEGAIVLRGPILTKEIPTLLNCVNKIPGVQSVDNQLEAHESPENVPDLQGQRKRARSAELIRETWTPGLRLIAGALGIGLIGHGIRRGSSLGVATGTLGGALALRAGTNLPLKRLTGIGAGPKAMVLKKTLHIHAPVEEVFGFWSNFENFPKFMTHVREVALLENNRSHWVVDGPAHTSLEWNAEVSSTVPNRFLAWKSVDRSAIRHSGSVHFEPVEGATRVHVQMDYNPPAGALGYLLATLLGANPKRQFDDDMIRMKSFLETGKPARDSKQKESVA
jgi:uncharacterized membrane protein